MISEEIEEPVEQTRVDDESVVGVSGTTAADKSTPSSAVAAVEFSAGVASGTSSEGAPQLPPPGIALLSERELESLELQQMMSGRGSQTGGVPAAAPSLTTPGMGSSPKPPAAQAAPAQRRRQATSPLARS